MTERKKNPQTKANYYYLLDDADVKRWHDNVSRGSEVTASIWLRRIGMVHKKFGKTPKDLAGMKPKEATDFLLDIVGTMEKEGKAGSYISGVLKPIKNWLAWNEITVQKKIKVRGSETAATLSDERTPTPEELRRIFDAADLKSKTACCLVSFSGVRLEVLGDYYGKDGLKLKDLPELTMRKNDIQLDKLPTKVIVRKTLSKTGNQYTTFLPEQGTEYLVQYLKWRIIRGEKLTPESPVITPFQPSLAGQHIRTTNISDLMRKAIRDAGFDWRPYVLRRYFDTRLMLAESDGLIIRDYRTYWMGHSGDIEHTYTVNKGLSKDVIEKMRSSYAKASAKYLETAARKESVTKEDMVSEFNKQFLRLSGYREEEISKLGNLSQMSTEQLQDMIRKKSMEALGLNGNHQKIVPLLELRNYIMQGWEYVSQLPNNEAIIRLPTN